MPGHFLRVPSPVQGTSANTLQREQSGILCMHSKSRMCSVTYQIKREVQLHHPSHLVLFRAAKKWEICRERWQQIGSRSGKDIRGGHYYLLLLEMVIAVHGEGTLNARLANTWHVCDIQAASKGMCKVGGATTFSWSMSLASTRP